MEKSNFVADIVKQLDAFGLEPQDAKRVVENDEIRKLFFEQLFDNDTVRDTVSKIASNEGQSEDEVKVVLTAVFAGCLEASASRAM